MMLVIPILFTLLGGLVFCVLWGWFIVPLGVSPITIPHAIGLALIVSIFKNKSSKNDKPLLDSFVGESVALLLMLGLGWIITLFM